MNNENVPRRCLNCGARLHKRLSAWALANKRGKYCCRTCFKTHRRPPKFWEHVNKGAPDECWEWRGVCAGGYGSLSYDIRDETGLAVRRVKVGTHRYSWEIHVGPIPDGLLVLHKCDNPVCVNPTHLFLGTLQDNMADRNAKGRQAHHERHPRARLTLEQVADIRAAFAAGRKKLQLARDYGVGRTTIQALLAGKTWKDA